MAHTAIDDERLQPDKPASALIGVRTRENVIASGTDRHSHGAIRYGTVTVPAGAVSTHPDHWFAIPFLAPWESGADTLNVRVTAGGHATLDTTWALWCEGTTGTPATLAGTATQLVSLSVGTPRSKPADGVMRCAILLRSEADATEDYELDIGAILPDRLTTTTDISVGPADGVAHYLATIDDASGKTWGGATDAERRWYCGHVDVDGVSGGDLAVWPAVDTFRLGGVTETSADAAIYLYPLATAVLVGADWWLSGAVLDPGALKVQLVSGAWMRARAIEGLQLAQVGVYGERSHVWASAVSSRSPLCGSGDTDAGSAVSILTTCGRWREDALALDLWLLAATARAASTVTIAWELSDAPFGGAYSQTGSRAVSLPYLSPRRRADFTRSVLPWVALDWPGGDEWGAGDLSYHGGDDATADQAPDATRYGLAHVAIEPGTAPTVGTYYRLTVTATWSNSLYVASALVRERVRVTP